MTPEQAQTIIDAIRAGYTRKYAREAAGVSEDVFRAWADSDGRDALSTAQQHFEIQAIMRIRPVAKQP